MVEPESSSGFLAGITALQRMGFNCVALSNGEVGLVSTISENNGFKFDHYVNLERHRVYKPHIDAYRTVEKDTGFKPEETLMVTANPTFGDVEGAQSVGMRAIVIRNGYPNTITELARHLAHNEFAGLLHDMLKRSE